jgi:hypothetical protein
MLVIVGKATPNKENGDVELCLRDFQKKLDMEGKFVYAWSFNPDESAIRLLETSIETDEDVYIYLPYDGKKALTRMKIEGFHHSRSGVPRCPMKWQNYCIERLSGNQEWGIHIWFLITNIENMQQPVELLDSFSPVFSNKYTKWGQNYFAFLHGS